MAELGIDVIAASGSHGDEAVSRDVLLDGRRRFDLRVTVAWVAGVGTSLWAHYGPEGMEIPRRVLLRMLHANFDYPYARFGITDDDRPMLMAELGDLRDADELGRGLVRLVVMADRLLEETAAAVAERGVLPDWQDRTCRNTALLDRYTPQVEALMPAWEAPTPREPRRGIFGRLLGRQR